MMETSSIYSSDASNTGMDDQQESSLFGSAVEGNEPIFNYVGDDEDAETVHGEQSISTPVDDEADITMISSDSDDGVALGFTYKKRTFGDFVYLKPPKGPAAARIGLCVKLLEDDPENTAEFLNERAPVGFKGNGTFLVQMKSMDELSTFRLDGVANWKSDGSKKRVGITSCTYYKTDDCPSFRKSVYILQEDQPNQKLLYAVVDYRWVDRTEPTEFVMAPRANSGGKMRQGCTSVGHRILRKVVTENPKLGIKDTLQKAQQVAEDNSCNVLSRPTVVRQVEPKRAVVKKESESDTLSVLLFRHGVSFTCANIRGKLSDAKNCVVSVQSEYQLAMLRQFGLFVPKNGLTPYSPLYIDGVFETSSYHMITTFFKHPCITRRNNRSPNVPTTGNAATNPSAAVIAGPTLLMTEKSQAEYVHAVQLMTASLQNFCSNNGRKTAKCDPWSWTPVIVTDNETAMRQALRYLIPNAKLLLCVLHSRNNTRMHLEKAYPGEDFERPIAAALVDVYGSVLSGKDEYFAGLVDCDTVDDFDAQFSALQRMWEKNLPGFHKWFALYQKTDICEILSVQ